MIMCRFAWWGLCLSQVFFSTADVCAQSGKDFLPIHAHSSTASLREDSLCGGDFTIEDSSWIDFTQVLPPLFRDRIALEKYIRDPRFEALRHDCGDTIAVDLIFARAYEIADGSMGHTLLIATLATFDHFRLGVIFPLIGVISFPLGLESSGEYKARYAHLPRRILPDSLGRYGRDKDKLQHFFGSAYLTYTLDSKSIAQSIGDFIEWGEPRFIVGGDDDERDKYANRLGREFGMRLLDGKKVLPSDILWKK
jgi:hypothetical protein